MKIAVTVVVAAVVVILITVVLFRSTRVELPAPGSIDALGDDLDAHVAALEARFDDVVPGTEKKITWNDATLRERTHFVVVALHGFSASRQETAPLAATVARGLNANLFETRLRGHGRGGQAMLEGSLRAWLADVREAMAIASALGDRTILIGTSTGGSLALWAGTRPEFARQLESIVLVSPNLGPRDDRAKLFLWPGGTTIARWINGPERSWEPVNDEHARYWTSRYPIEALQPMMQLVAGVQRLDFASIQASTLLVHSTQDEVIDVDAARAAFEAIGAGHKSRFVVDDGGDPEHHVLAGDVLSPQTTDRVAREIVRFVVME